MNSRNQLNLEEFSPERMQDESGHSVSTNSPLLEGVNGHLSSGLTSGPPVLQSAHSFSAQWIIDLNTVYESYFGLSIEDGIVGTKRRLTEDLSNISGNSESLWRNVCPRNTASHQDLLPANASSFGNAVMNSRDHLPTQPSIGSPLNLDTIFPGNVASTSQNNSPVVVQPSPAPGYILPYSPEVYVQRQSTVITGSTSQNISRVGVQPSAPPGFPQRNIAEGSLNSFGAPHNLGEAFAQSNNHLWHPSASTTMQNMTTARAGDPRALEGLPRTGVLMTRSERQSTDFSPFPPELQAIDVNQRSAMLVSEVHCAREVLHRSEPFQDEDVRIIDRSAFYGEPEEEEEQEGWVEHDMHGDMRLDVDDMSYEELLALEEQIGSVNTGLSQEAISSCTRRYRCQSVRVGPPADEEPCCICQDEYINGQELGKLGCGHDFHFICIKQWLMQKNSCPICKNACLS